MAKHDDDIAAKVAELKAKVTPDRIKRMTALFQAEVARRDAAKKAAARPTAAAGKPPAGEKSVSEHAREILKLWRPKN